MMRQLSKLAVVLATALAWAPLLSATTILKVSEEAMALQAAVIMHGEAVSSESVRIDGQLVTLVKVRPIDTLKGEAATVTVVIPGGIDNSLKFPVATTYPGAPRLLIGQEIFLFLEKNPALIDTYSVMGFSQGAYQISREPGAGATVARNMAGIRIVGPGADAESEATSSSLETFKQRVRGYLSSPRALEQKQ